MTLEKTLFHACSPYISGIFHKIDAVMPIYPFGWKFDSKICKEA